MRYAFQLFSGDLTRESCADAKAALDYLKPYLEKGCVEAVFSGWATDLSFYQKLKDGLQPYKVPLFFKYSVFSELTVYSKQYQEIHGKALFEPLIDIHQREEKGYRLNEQENFLFRCPASSVNIQKSLEIYEEFFSDFSFDGLMLDRIRYPSFAAGMTSIQTCFCPGCVEAYQAFGIDVEALKEDLDRIANKKMDLSLWHYQDGTWEFCNDNLQRFFTFRTQAIINAVHVMAAYFHEKGMKVGVDAFTPALGFFCGQDVKKLQKEVDFIKPMLYRYTHAPAGIPFERTGMEEMLGDKAAVLMEQEVGSRKDDYKEMVRKELEVLQTLSDCQVWPGIEANYIDPIARITPNQLEDSLHLLEERNVQTVVISWNLSKIPMENSQVLLSRLK